MILHATADDLEHFYLFIYKIRWSGADCNRFKYLYINSNKLIKKS